MPTETVTITVSGANPQTKQVAINVDPSTGSGGSYVSFTGVNGGQDTFSAQASIAGTNYTSNSAFVAWQATNGVVSLLTGTANGINGTVIGGYINPNGGNTWNGVGGQYGLLTGKTTVVVNQVYTGGAAGTGTPISGLVTNNGDTGQYRHVPPMLDDVKSDGTALTSLGSVLGWGQGAAGNGSHVTFFEGNLLVTAAGIQTFYFNVDDSWALYVGGGATRNNGTYTGNAIPSAANAAAAGTNMPNVGAWPLMGYRNAAANSVQNADWLYINFPAPGIYPFLAWWVNNGDAQSYFQQTYTAGAGAIPSSQFAGGGVLKPVAAQPVPPATTPNPSGLALSLTQSNFQLQGQTVQVFVSVAGVHYATKQYIPILEGTPGKLFIYNDPSHVFNFQTYNGAAVDKPSAANAVFTLGGNTQSLFKVAYNDSGDGQFSLLYNGAAFPAGIAAATTLSVTAEDVAWFNSNNKTFDTFVPNATGGGISFAIEVDYQVHPTDYSLSPGSVTANGSNQVFTVTLNKAMSAGQLGANNTGNTVNASFSASAGVTVQNVQQVINGAGALTGYNVTLFIPSSTVNGSFNLSLTLTGTLTYLSGSTFVTTGVTYMSGVTKTVSTIGVQFAPPVAYQFTVSPNGGGVLSTTQTLTATVYTFDNNTINLTFQSKPSAGGATVNLSPVQSAPTNSFTGTVNGQTAYYKTFTYSFVPTAQPAGSEGQLLGFVATDTVSSLSVQYFSTTVYTFPSAGSGGGGCPAVEMFIDEQHQVCDVFDGMSLEALVGEVETYLEQVDGEFVNQPVDTETRHVEWHDFDTQPCHLLVAENGAEVIVSASTPVPTRQSIMALKQGAEPEAIPVYANQIFAGMEVLTNVGKGPEWSMLVETQALGMRRVCRLYCGGRNFASGSKRGKYIYTHNIICGK